MKKKMYDTSSYYEVFAGYEGSKKDLAKLAAMNTVPYGKIPSTYTSAVIPMAGKVGKKGK